MVGKNRPSRNGRRSRRSRWLRVGSIIRYDTTTMCRRRAAAARRKSGTATTPRGGRAMRRLALSVVAAFFVLSVAGAAEPVRAQTPAQTYGPDGTPQMELIAET